MSSNHHCQNGGPKIGEIDHSAFLSDHLGSLCISDNYSDVTLKVDGQTIPAHKVILAARSEYFRALLFGGMRESSETDIELKGTNAEPFKLLLKYIYSGHMSLGNIKEEMILEILGLAHQYGFVELEAAISDYLRESLTVRSCCIVYDCARMYNLKFLMDVAASFIDKYADEVIRQDTFLMLSAESVIELVSKDSFFAAEVDIFKALIKWIRANPNVSTKTTSDIMSVIRLPLMNIEELLTVVRPSHVLSADKILDAIEEQEFYPKTWPECCYRGLLLPDTNMASPKCGGTVVQGEMRAALLDGDSHNYDLERGYTRHAIAEGGTDAIVIKLGTQCIVNHIKMLLWDKDSRSYSYYIEVSVDNKEFTKVVDYTKYFCRSWQYLHFQPLVVRYVKIVGTNNTVNKVFHAVSFEIMYLSKPPVLEKGFVVPKYNVATTALGATVVEGVSRVKDSLLDGNVTGYDWDSGYTCHQLGSGTIIVQLAQPYVIDSMRLLLWDCDNRSYSYFIEVSVNMRDWELVVDRSKDSCKSWQTLRMKEKRPVVFIRITGTHNSANEVFHCVHFECPAQIQEARGKSWRYSNEPKQGTTSSQIKK